MPNLSKESAKAFADQCRSARLLSLADAEAFDQIIHVLERLGSYLAKEEYGDLGKQGDLGKYLPRLLELVRSQGLTNESEPEIRALLTPFEALYELVRAARNDAVHQGSSARHLTKHAIELVIILEDALRAETNLIVADFMVRNPACGEPWQPLAFLRQQMLANSYSYLPVLMNDGRWCVVSDIAIAAFLGAERTGKERAKRLAMTLKDALELPEKALSALLVEPIDEDMSLNQALAHLRRWPILLVRSSTGVGLLGIVTAFDLL